MADSTQHQLTRVRPPRVRITYDVETGGTEQKRELPFVVGVLADLSGDPTSPKKSFRDRKFIEIDGDNFNEVMAKMTPGVNTKVKNTLAGDDSQMAVSLQFNAMSDFEPASIVEQVEPLRKLLETRNQLRDLLTRVDRSEDLESLLQSVLTNEDELKALTSQLGEASDSNDSDSQE